MSEKVIYEEIYGNNDKKNIVVKSDKALVLETSGSSTVFSLSIRNLILFLKEVFLPKGFPDSVHPDYIPYQLWDTVQAFASTILGTLTTHSILQGIGVGESTATPLAAAISWIVKDGTGMIGRILFAWWKGSELDAQCKKWRLFADVLNDIAMGIELTLPYFSLSSITLMLCMTTAMKSIVGVAGGATRAALTEHQALTHNLADVSAKDGSQETFVNLVASLVGIFILSTSQNMRFLIVLYFILVSIHIYANYSAVKALRLNSLNEDRLASLVHNYIMNQTILEVERANQEESLMLFHRPSKKYCGCDIKLGISLTNILKNCDNYGSEDITEIIRFYHNNKYLILRDIKQEIVYVILQRNVQSSDVLNAYFDAYFHGLEISLKLKKQQTILNRYKLSKYCVSKLMTDYLYKRSIEMNFVSTTDEDAVETMTFRNFYKSLQQSEWNHNRVLLPVDNWRGNWKDLTHCD